MTKFPPLSPRLSAIADLVPEGIDLLADIGTDHAHLPVHLIRSGKVQRAIAADIARGPLDRAEKTIKAASLSDRITLRLTDGLTGLETAPLSHIVIAGMGGELMIHILEHAPFVKDRKIPLILQPMTRADVLRIWLAEHGFRVERESLCAEDDRIYQILSVVYDGKIHTLTKLESLIGQGSLARTEPIFKKQFSRLIQVYTARIEGKESARLDASEEKAIVQALQNAKEVNP